jgi:hypothetical protein
LWNAEKDLIQEHNKLINLLCYVGKSFKSKCRNAEMKLVQHRHSAGSQLRQSGIGIRTVGHGFDRHCPCPAMQFTKGDNLLTMHDIGYGEVKIM